MRAILSGLVMSTLLGLVPLHAKAVANPLDFWIGEWEVFTTAGQQLGRNRIESVLEGHAVLEHWRGAEDGEGKSLFYFRAAEGKWKQVWVTSNGGTKEKAQVDAPDGAVRFQGEQTSRDRARRWLDRTTLRPQPDGSVEQTIETSEDAGATWQLRFTGIYRRAETASAAQSPMNTIQWFQIPAADIERAVKFYSAVLGWTFHRQDDPMGRHAFISAAPGAVTGEIVQTAFARPSGDGARIFVRAPDGIEAALAKVSAAGGSIVMPRTSLGPMGVIAVIADTEGNQVGLHSAQ